MRGQAEGSPDRWLPAAAVTGCSGGEASREEAGRGRHTHRR
jgi:hypothetical protein